MLLHEIPKVLLWTVSDDNKEQEFSKIYWDFNRNLIGIFPGYTLWLRERRKMMTVKKQHQPSLGSPELLYLQNLK